VAASAPAASPATELVARLNNVRDVCNHVLGAVGESVVHKHYVKAKSELERGAGSEAIEEAINQIARATSILKGPSTTDALLEQLKTVR
jgi:predicted site-specific integrase-resolvase